LFPPYIEFSNTTLSHLSIFVKKSQQLRDKKRAWLVLAKLSLEA